MTTFLEELLEMYERSHPPKSTEIDRALSEELDKAEEKLRVTINQDQAALLSEITRCYIKMELISERTAFIKGVKFATRYMLEALED